MTNLQNNKWKYSTIGLLAVLAVGFSFPQASADITNSLTHNVAHILESIVALQSDVSDIQSDVNDIHTDVTNIENGIGTLGQNAVTVKVVAPAEADQLEILPNEFENDRMYVGHVNGIISLTAVEDTNVQLNCAVHINNAPLMTLARLDSLDPPAFQSILVDEEFTCTSLTLQYNGDNTNGVQASLAISYTEVDGIEEIEVSP